MFVAFFGLFERWIEGKRFGRLPPGCTSATDSQSSSYAAVPYRLLYLLKMLLRPLRQVPRLFQVRCAANELLLCWATASELLIWLAAAVVGSLQARGI